MSISEQVKELREIAIEYGLDDKEEIENLLNEAADTIESLSAKLSAKNMERSELNYGRGDVISRDRLINEFFQEMPHQFGAQVMDWFRGLVDNQPKVLPDYGGGWIVSRVINGDYICCDELKNCNKDILITYRTLTGRRYTKQVLCNHGRVEKKLKGDVIAWQPLPEPYRRT